MDRLFDIANEVDKVLQRIPGFLIEGIVFKTQLQECDGIVLRLLVRRADVLAVRARKQDARGSEKIVGCGKLSAVGLRFPVQFSISVFLQKTEFLTLTGIIMT